MRAIKVGDNEAALFGHVATRRSVDHLLVDPLFGNRAVIRTVRIKRVATLVDQPWKAYGTVPDAPPGGPHFAVAIEIGLSEIVLRETETGACAEAKKKIHEDSLAAITREPELRANHVATVKLDETGRASICGAVGRYAWSKNRYVKA